MALIQAKNPWGAQGTGLDPLRPDLFRIDLAIPPAVLGGGVNLWEATVSFAVQSFPFPERVRQMIPVKWLNQTNFVVGADEPLPPVDLIVRNAFNVQTAEILERWHQLTSNSQNGGVAITSQVKTNGFFYFLIPNPTVAANPTDTSDGALQDGPAYYLEGVLIRGLKIENTADMTVGNEYVRLALNLQIDRYYPTDPANLTVATPPAP
jgi:hypothetical protein